MTQREQLKQRDHDCAGRIVERLGSYPCPDPDTIYRKGQWWCRLHAGTDTYTRPGMQVTGYRRE